jgi:hypothetical protein
MINQAPLSVLDYGAVGDNVVDCTAAFNSAIAAGLANNQAVYIPSGDYKITAGLTQINETMVIFGDGRGVTRIYFAPTAANQILFDVYKATGVLDRFSLGGFSVFGQTSNKLTYLRIDNISGGDFYELEFNGGGNTATDSIGMDLKGRELCNFKGTYLFNMGQPIVVNPGVSGGIDHFNFTDLYILVSQNPPLYPLFKVNANAVTANTSFTGSQAWVGGLGAFDHAGTSGINFLFENLRFESAGVKIADANIVPTFKFNPSAFITGIEFNNCYVSSVDPVTVGTRTTDFFFRRCVFINFINTSVSHATSGHESNWIDADNTCNNINVNNFLDTPGGHGYEILGSDLTEVASTSGEQVSPPNARPNRILIKQTAITGISPFPALQLDGSFVYNNYVTMTNGQTINLASYSKTICQYIVGFSDGATPEVNVGGGHIIVTGPNTAGTPDANAVKISGTANLVAGVPSAGNVGIYKNVGDNTIKIENSTGVSISISVLVMYSNT